MKIYKCDQCGDEFDSKDGMIEGYYRHTRKVKLYKTGWADEKKGYKVRKTLKLYRTVSTSTQLTPIEVEIKKDLCPRCVKMLEKP